MLLSFIPSCVLLIPHLGSIMGIYGPMLVVTTITLHVEEHYGVRVQADFFIEFRVNVTWRDDDSGTHLLSSYPWRHPIKYPCRSYSPLIEFLWNSLPHPLNNLLIQYPLWPLKSNIILLAPPCMSHLCAEGADNKNWSDLSRQVIIIIRTSIDWRWDPPRIKRERNEDGRKVKDHNTELIKENEGQRKDLKTEREREWSSFLPFHRVYVAIIIHSPDEFSQPRPSESAFWGFALRWNRQW